MEKQIAIKSKIKTTVEIFIVRSIFYTYSVLTEVTKLMQCYRIVDIVQIHKIVVIERERVYI